MNLKHLLTSSLIITILAVFISLSGCETVPVSEQPGAKIQADYQRINELEQAGQYVDAAVLLMANTSRVAEPQASIDKLDAARLYIYAGMIDQAENIVQSLQTGKNTPEIELRVNLIKARIYLFQEQPEAALALLNAGSVLNIEVLTTLHELRARAYLALGNYLESARERVQLEPYLKDQERITFNRGEIWERLRLLTFTNLSQIEMPGPPDVFSGWLELALISKATMRSSQQFDSEIATWREKYPQHPAAYQILDNLTAYHEVTKKRDRLALILPLSGKLAKAAAAVRDGFLAAHYQIAYDEQDIQIKIYDSTRDDRSIQQLYQLAVSEGAEFVIGPLSKEKVVELANMSQLVIPVLALNQSDEHFISHPKLYQFGLNPEDEARQVAERASAEGMTQALSITPRGEWGTRMATAFRQRFEELGGVVLEQTEYEFSGNDFSAPIKRMLNINESDARFQRLRNALPTELHFTPRRRQDVDFIFMAAFPKQARLITPQLRFHHAADVPVYTTSSAYSSLQTEQQNRDMNGVMMCDSHWIIASDEQAEPLRKQLKELWPQEMALYGSLFALGIDAYSLPAQLRWLEQNPHEYYEGVTGRLSLNSQKQLQRTLKWGKFDDGKLELVDDRVKQENMTF
jgi:outer membrane PBP1 activator LpoA protein